MNPTPTSLATESERRAHNLASLLDMGFECVEGPVTTEALRLATGRWRVTQAVPAMGTVVSLAVVHESRALADDAVGLAFDEMARTVALLNRYDSASALGVLNDVGRLAGAPDELLEVLSHARGLHWLSHGAFDVTVAPLVDLLQERRAAGVSQKPSSAELGLILEQVGHDRLVVEGRSVRMDAGMGVTLDGIAKGYIVDHMAAVLVRLGAADHLINAGGDIRVSGNRGDESPWTVAVQDPDKAGKYPDVLQLHQGALATSGSYEIYFDRERTSHHIVSSSNGLSPLGCRSVTVRTTSAMHADALATAVFVMGPQAGLDLIESIPRSECLIVTSEDAQVRSSGWGELSSAT